MDRPSAPGPPYTTKVALELVKGQLARWWVVAPGWVRVEAGDATLVTASVSCVSANFCAAAWLVHHAIANWSVADNLTDGVWKRAPPYPPMWPTQKYLRGVYVLEGLSCLSARLCVGVSNGGVAMQICDAQYLCHRTAAWDGRRWHAVVSPSQNGTELTSVDCADTTRCVAVGSFGSSSENPFPAHVRVEWWNGLRWTVQPAVPQPTS